MKRVQMIVSGKVQGVFFRKYTKEKAEELFVNGWVANESDGTVTVMAEGADNAVNHLAEWCQSGPSTAQVEKVVVVEEPFLEEFDDFQIRY